MSKPQVRPERTGWRDEALSARHRAWGQDAPCVDMDFVLIEFDHAVCKAVVEYKNQHAELQYPNHASYRAIKDLCDRAQVPFFACRYADDFSWFKAVPLNKFAKDFLPERTEMSEREWVSFLYKLRGREMPDGLFDDMEGF